MNNTDYSIIEPWLDSVGRGWHPLIKQGWSKIYDLHPDIEINQVKEKFGGLRFYVGFTTREVWDIIEEMEKESYKTCEECGTKEKVTTEGDGWLRTLCPGCRSTAG
jgi:hypothetical protein